jgi:hypothetical protein
MYAPARSAVYFLGALILERIVRLDRIRLMCFKAADASMGYVELKHFVRLFLCGTSKLDMFFDYHLHKFPADVQLDDHRHCIGRGQRVAEANQLSLRSLRRIE